MWSALGNSKKISECCARLAGFASIDYQLSQHPEFPQDPASTPRREYREARHPDHLNDVRSGLAFLQREYGIASNYILLGHSAGATLAFQVLATAAGAGVEVTLPKAVVGIAGIYDFNAVNSRSNGAYAPFLSMAFGQPGEWNRVAPMNFLGDINKNWRDSGRVILGWSRNDELVDEPEIDNMALRLCREHYSLNVHKDLEGGHDECWANGAGMARLVVEAMSSLASQE